MRVGLAIYTDRFSPNDKISYIINLGEQLKEYFKPQNYGNILNEIYFGVVILSGPFKDFYDLGKPKPKYVKSKKMFECDVVYDFEQFVQLEDSAVRQFIIDGIVKILPNLAEKVKNFDIIAFEKDLKNFR